MPKIKTFEGYLVNPQSAEEVVSPAYDSVSPEQRRLYAETHPRNFLNTMRLLEDYPAENRPSPQALLEINKSNLNGLLSDGSYDVLPKSCLFLYQLNTGTHVQTGLVCEIGVVEYEQGLVKKHENTRSDKEDLLTRYLEVVGVASSPICLTYPKNNDIDDYVDHLIQRPADLEFTSEHEVMQKVWRIEDSQTQQHLTALFSRIDATYLTDGHHRAASNLRYAEIMREKHGNNGAEPYNQLLVVLFPDNQLNLLPFHRCVHGLNHHSESEIVTALEKSFTIQKCTDNKPLLETSEFGEFGMCINNHWYRLKVKDSCVDTEDPVNSLDVAILQNLILYPIFGIKDMRSDPRLDYIAGVGGETAIMQKHAEGWQAIFTCYPTSIDQLLKVADTGGLMPPKSTYFDPKPRSGIFIRVK